MTVRLGCYVERHNILSMQMDLFALSLFVACLKFENQNIRKFVIFEGKAHFVCISSVRQCVFSNVASKCESGKNGCKQRKTCANRRFCHAQILILRLFLFFVTKHTHTHTQYKYVHVYSRFHQTNERMLLCDGFFFFGLLFSALMIS